MAQDPPPRKPAPDELDAYDIVEPIQEEPVSRFDPAQARLAKPQPVDRGIDLDIGADVPPPIEGDGTGKPRPKLLEGIPEPKFVDPQVQAMRREEARIRAAQDEAARDARRRWILLTIVGIGLMLVSLIGAAVYLFY